MDRNVIAGQIQSPDPQMATMYIIFGSCFTTIMFIDLIQFVDEDALKRRE